MSCTDCKTNSFNSLEARCVLFNYDINVFIYITHNNCSRGRDRAVGIATCYRLDGPGSNTGGGEIFPTHPDRPWSPPILLYNG